MNTPHLTLTSSERVSASLKFSRSAEGERRWMTIG